MSGCNLKNYRPPVRDVCVCLCPQACERDLQCGLGSCCAVSLWLRGLRMCTPRGREGDECHPFSHKVRARRFHSSEKQLLFLYESSLV
ncbi:PROK1 protein, partial [Polyodon spathula]|nr:PROK1 protein [Polyodon spathula]